MLNPIPSCLLQLSLLELHRSFQTLHPPYQPAVARFLHSSSQCKFLNKQVVSAHSLYFLAPVCASVSSNFIFCSYYSTEIPPTISMWPNSPLCAALTRTISMADIDDRSHFQETVSSWLAIPPVSVDSSSLSSLMTPCLTPKCYKFFRILL